MKALIHVTGESILKKAVLTFLFLNTCLLALAQLNSTSSQTISTSQTYTGASKISNNSTVTVSGGTTTFNGNLTVGNSTAGSLVVKSGATVIVNGILTIGTGSNGAVVIENGGKLIVNPGSTGGTAAVSVNSTAATALDVQTGGSIVVNAGTNASLLGLYETSSSNVSIAGSMQIRGGGFKMDGSSKLSYTGSGNDTIIGPSNAGAYFTNTSTLTVGANVNLYISGDVKHDSNSSFVINGNVSVNGNYQSGNNTANVTGTGTLNTTGSLDADSYQGSVFGQRYSCATGPCAGSNIISSSNTNTCSGGVVNINGAAVSGATYQWYVSTTSTTAGFSAITGATSQNYSTTGSATTQYTYYKRQYTLSGSTYNSNTLTITSSYWTAAPVVAPISGSSSVCAGSAITLTDATSGGTWSSGTTSIATINSSGVVTGVSDGASVISYTVTSGGCAGAATKTITVIGTPVATTISASGSYTVPAGAKAVQIQVWGAGGGGSKGYSNLKGTGGSGGGFAQKTMTITGGSVLSATVGTGGNGATTSGNGATGGTSSVSSGSVIVSASGGEGGISTSTPSGTGGASGDFVTGDFGYTGGVGATIQQPTDATPGGGAGGSAGTASNGNNAGNTSTGSGSSGGTAVTGGGAGGNGGTTNATGDVGGLPGGGGGGNAGTGNGGNGANGRIIITAYYTSITYSSSSFCKTVTSASPTIDGVTGGTFSAASGLVINASTGNINPSTSTAGNYTISYSNSCGVISTTFVKIVAAPTATAGGAQTICQSATATVSGASSSNGTISWTENGAGSITSGTSTLTPVYTSVAADAGNTVTLTMKVSNGTCTDATATYSVVVTTCAKTWTGTTSTAWSTNANWSPASVPTPMDDVTIPSTVASNRMPTISTSVNAKSVTNNGTITMTSAGTLNTYGDVTNNGTFTTVAGSTVTFKGSSVQNVTGVTTLYNVVVNNTNGVALQSALAVNGTLSLTKGVVTTNSNLTINFDNGGNIGYSSSDLGSISGTVTGKRNLVAKTHYIGVPFSGVTSAQVQATTPLYLNNYWKMYSRAFEGQNWKAVTDVTTAMPIGTGFSLALAAAAPVVFTGTYDHTLSFTTPSYTNTASGKYLFVGNPYPSTLDWDNASGWTKTNVGGAIYYWDAANSRVASYVGGLGTNGGTQYIPAMQAVLVALTGSGGNSSIAINNNARISTQNPAYMRTASDAVIRIRIEDSSATKNDETVIRFHNDATSGFDQELDARKMLNSSTMPSLYTTSGTELYSINSYVSPDSAKVIPLAAKLPADGTYKLIIENDDQTVEYVLVDKQTGAEHKIKQAYTFSGLKADDVNRFELQLRTSVTTGTQDSQGIGALEIYSSTKGFVIQTDKFTGSDASIEIIDMTGNTVEKMNSVLAAGSTYVPVNASGGVYLVRVSVNENIFSEMISLIK